MLSNPLNIDKSHTYRRRMCSWVYAHLVFHPKKIWSETCWLILRSHGNKLRFKAKERMNLTRLTHSFLGEIIKFNWLGQVVKIQNKCPTNNVQPVDFVTQYCHLQGSCWRSIQLSYKSDQNNIYKIMFQKIKNIMVF